MDLGRCIVNEIKPERLTQNREKLAAFDPQGNATDEARRAMAWLVLPLIDLAWRVDPVQLALKNRLIDSFHSAAVDGNIRNGLDAERIDLDCEGAITPKHNERDVRHDTSTKHHSKDHEGGHLLPRI